MIKKIIIVLCIGIFTGFIGPTYAASLVDEQTDDSVCDLGHASKNTGKLSSLDKGVDFISSKCRNGQVLIGSSIVPASSSDSTVITLAKKFCMIADIQTKRTQIVLGGSLPMEIDEVRCTIKKLPNQKK